MTRADLPPGDQAVQAAHAGLAFALRHDPLLRQWDDGGGYLIFLAADDEPHLGQIFRTVQARGHAAVPFREPDLGGALTAVAFTGEARRLLAGLPLALKGKAMTTITAESPREVIGRLEHDLTEAREEIGALRSQLGGDELSMIRWLQWKVLRQRTALDVLNRKIVSQRFVLRTLGELGRGLTKAEYDDARNQVSNTALRDRIEKSP